MTTDASPDISTTSPKPGPPAPLLPVAVGMAAGIVLDSFLNIPPMVSFSAIIPATITARFLRGPRFLAAAGLVIGAAGLGALRHAVADRYLPPDHVVRHAQAEPVLAQITGYILTDPRIVEPDPEQPRAFPIEPRTQFLLEARSLAGESGPIEVSGRVAVTIRRPRLGLAVGDQVEMTGWLFTPRGPQNPGQFDWRLYNHRQDIRAAFSCEHAEGVRVTASHPEGGWTRALSAARKRLRGYLVDDAFADDEAAAGVMSAIVLGQRSAVPRAMDDAFRQTGNAHFLAASGLHVGWVALLVWAVARLLGLYYRTTALLVAAVIVSYVLVAEPRPSILRAGIIGVLVCAAAFFRGRYNSTNALACAAILILMFRPADLFSAAFQFSFLATFGLLHFCPLLSQALSEWLLRRNRLTLARVLNAPLGGLAAVDAIDHSAERRRPVAVMLIGLCAQLLVLSVSEWLITAPLSCRVFDMFVPFGWLGSYLLWFFAMPAALVGYVTVLLGAILPSSAALLSPLLAAAAGAMIGCVELLTRIPPGIVSGRSPSLPWVIAAYATIALWAYRRHWLPGRHTYKLIAVALVLWWFISPRWVKAQRDALLVWTLAVGDGSATVIELPDGRALIYDAGTRSNLDAGMTMIDFLKHRGITRIDAAFVSHTDFDHFSALEAVAGEIEINRVVINDHFEPSAPQRSAPWHFLEAMRRKGIHIDVTHGPAEFPEFAPARISKLWPPPHAQKAFQSANDASTVLRIEHQGRVILLTGDILGIGMASLLAEAGPPPSNAAKGDNQEARDDGAGRDLLRADVLALPHHGSVDFNTAAFIDRVDPAVAIRSTGQRRAMTTNGIDQLAAGRRYFSTADDGCILVRVKDGALSASAVMTGE